MPPMNESTVSTLTNKINLDFDYAEILRRYDLYEIPIPDFRGKEAARKKFYARIRREISPLARAVVGRTYFFMVRKGTDIDGNDLGPKRVGLARLKEMKDSSLFSMLLSLMVGEHILFDIPENPYKLYYPYSFGMTKGADMLALEVEVKEREEGVLMFLGARSFKIVHSPKEGGSGYLVEDAGALRPYVPQQDVGRTVYEKGSRGDTRARIPFLCLDHRFRQSKTYFFHRISEEVRTYLAGLVRLEFSKEEFQIYTLAKDKKKKLTRLDETIRHYAKDIPRVHIAVLDHRCDEAARRLAKEMEAYINRQAATLFDGEFILSMGESIDSSVPNISLTLEKEFYEKNGESDPYADIPGHVPVQNFTVSLQESKRKTGETILGVLLKELAIKCELLGYDPFIDHGEVLKGYRFYSIENFRDMDSESAIYGVSWMEGGRMKASAITDSDRRTITRALSGLPRGEVPEYVITDPEGNTVLGTRTAFMPLPDFDYLDRLFRESTSEYYFSKNDVVRCADMTGQYPPGQKDPSPGFDDPRTAFLSMLDEMETPKGVPSSSLMKRLRRHERLKKALEKTAGRPLRFLPRGRDHKHAFAGMLGIQYREENGDVLYRVGLSDVGIVECMDRNSPYRKIVKIGGKIDGDFLFSLMEHYFVKNKELTVMPYPVKYAREGAKERSG